MNTQLVESTTSETLSPLSILAGLLALFALHLLLSWVQRGESKPRVTRRSA